MTTFEVPDEVLDAAFEYYAGYYLNAEEAPWELIEKFLHFATGQPRLMSLIEAIRSVEREFNLGERCPVCGRTTKQNEAIGYNCMEEC